MIDHHILTPDRFLRDLCHSDCFHLPHPNLQTPFSASILLYHFFAPSHIDVMHALPDTSGRVIKSPAHFGFSVHIPNKIVFHSCAWYVSLNLPIALSRTVSIVHNLFPSSVCLVVYWFRRRIYSA